MKCLCGHEQGALLTVHGVDVKRCSRCGIIRQDAFRSEAACLDYYAERYHDGICTHTLDQDQRVARLRLDKYRTDGVYPGTGQRLLDVGSGNCAFVDEARARGNRRVYGCDLVGPTDRVYIGTVPQIGFPGCYFDLVTMHDTLEHLWDPAAVLSECHRMLKPGGRLVIDFPRFHVQDGDHHWKPNEHLWMLRSKDLESLIEKAGFKVDAISTPIPSKLLVYATKQVDRMATILVPPGIGDIYWVLCKLQGFLASRKLGTPAVTIASLDDRGDRALDYVDCTPFVYAAGCLGPGAIRKGKNLPIWRQAYLGDNGGVFERVLGFDYFLSMNGGTRCGRSLDEIMPAIPTNWYPPLFQPIDGRGYGTSMRAAIGDYIVGYFAHHGMYRNWLQELPPSAIYGILSQVRAATGLKVILTGREWDIPDKPSVNERLLSLDQSRGRFLVDLRGKTSLPELFSLLHASAGCFGFCAGNTIMSVVFGVPTVMVWNKYFDRRFWLNACPPDSLNQWYFPVDTADDAGTIANTMITALGMAREAGRNRSIQDALPNRRRRRHSMNRYDVTVDSLTGDTTIVDKTNQDRITIVGTVRAFADLVKVTDGLKVEFNLTMRDVAVSFEPLRPPETQPEQPTT